MQDENNNSNNTPNNHSNNHSSDKENQKQHTQGDNSAEDLLADLDLDLDLSFDLPTDSSADSIDDAAAEMPQQLDNTQHYNSVEKTQDSTQSNELFDWDLADELEDSWDEIQEDSTENASIDHEKQTLDNKQNNAHTADTNKQEESSLDSSLSHEQLNHPQLGNAQQNISLVNDGQINDNQYAEQLHQSADAQMHNTAHQALQRNAINDTAADTQEDIFAKHTEVATDNYLTNMLRSNQSNPHSDAQVFSAMQPTFEVNRPSASSAAMSHPSSTSSMHSKQLKTSANPYQAPTANYDQAVIEDDYELEPNTWYHLFGRIGRLRYFSYPLLIISLSMLGLGIAAAGLDRFLPVESLTFVILAPVFLFTSIIYPMRRLHDLGHSGWFCLLGLVPMLNVIFGLYLLLAPGQKGVNEYGNPPRPNKWYHGFGILFGIICIVGVLAAIAIPAYQGYVYRAQQSQADVMEQISQMEAEMEAEMEQAN